MPIVSLCQKTNRKRRLSLRRLTTRGNQRKETIKRTLLASNVKKRGTTQTNAQKIRKKKQTRPPTMK